MVDLGGFTGRGGLGSHSLEKRRMLGPWEGKSEAFRFGGLL